MIFVDANVPMYLVGAAHPHKSDAQLTLESLIAAKHRLVCDAEVLQEILHRYSAIDRHAAEIVSGKRKLKACDALHIAVMERYQIDSIVSFDADFDRCPGIDRISKI